MKIKNYDWAIQATVAMLLAGSAMAEDTQRELNHFSFSGRFGFNIGVKMKDAGVATVSPVINNNRTTPSDPNRPGGDPYNYDNGYIYPDISGSGDGMTWYWGYDDSASQINSSTLNPGNYNSALPDNSILFSRTTSVGTSSGSQEFNDCGPYPGFELTYSRELGRDGENSYGLEFALNYLNLCMDAKSEASTTITTQTDAYLFADGTTPPSATPSLPYQQTYSGPLTGTAGFMLNNTVAGTVISYNTAAVAGRYKFQADLFGFRMGPYFEYPLDEKTSLTLAAGFAFNVVSADASWREVATSGSVSSTTSYSDNITDVLWGGYAGGSINYRINPDWTAVGGFQWQDLSCFSHNLGAKKVELDMSSSIFLVVGLSYSF